MYDCLASPNNNQLMNNEPTIFPQKTGSTFWTREVKENSTFEFTHSILMIEDA